LADKDNKKIVFVFVCYDLLHLGYIINFNFCKSKGDIFVVTTGNDKTIRTLKGSGSPVNSEKFRARMIAAIEYVDYVVISEEYGKMDHAESMKLLRPDVYVLNSTDSAVVEKRKLVEENGGKLLLCKRLPPGHRKGGISTTELKKKIKK
ncbi:MAG: hypothetical protein NTY30_00065, partial [Candidatus Berkelbacteria bacterium]|nr:hypothetical protein [Candidatus Berkelbacteria bacterium]